MTGYIPFLSYIDDHSEFVENELVICIVILLDFAFEIFKMLELV